MLQIILADYTDYQLQFVMFWHALTTGEHKAKDMNHEVKVKDCKMCFGRSSRLHHCILLRTLWQNVHDL